MCGFNYFDTHGHEAKGQSLHSIQIFGSAGNMRLIGYDWETSGVVLDNSYRTRLHYMLQKVMAMNGRKAPG